MAALGDNKMKFVSIRIQRVEMTDESLITVYLRDKTEYINKLIMKDLVHAKQERIT